MTWPNDYEEWFRCAEELHKEAVFIIGSVKIDSANGLNDPRVYASCLLLRTLRSTLVIFNLVRSGDVTEANIVARSCVENLLWLRGLRERGLDFVEQIKADTLRSGAGIAELIKNISDFDGDIELTALIEKQILGRSNKFLNLGDVSASEEAKLDYSVFRMLSNQYAHPSLVSLERHVVSDVSADLFTLTLYPDVKVRSLIWTMFIVSGVVISSLGLFLEMTEISDEDIQSLCASKLQYLFEKFRELGTQAGLDGSGSSRDDSQMS